MESSQLFGIRVDIDLRQLSLGRGSLLWRKRRRWVPLHSWSVVPYPFGAVVVSKQEFLSRNQRPVNQSDEPVVSSRLAVLIETD